MPQRLCLNALQETRNPEHSRESSCAVCLGTREAARSQKALVHMKSVELS